MDCWIIGFEFKIRIKMKDWERNSKRAISDFMNVAFCVYLLDLHQSIYPIIHGTMLKTLLKTHPGISLISFFLGKLDFECWRLCVSVYLLKLEIVKKEFSSEDL